MNPLKIAIVGATGYTGSELVRLLHHHPSAQIVQITSESKAGMRFSDIHPHFQNICDIPLVKAENIKDDLDFVFLALPHGVSMEYVKQWKNRPFKIIDLSGDFRLSGKEVYEKWYDKPHTFPEGFAQAAYGLPELNRANIKDARLVANPGCYPTSAVLGLIPLAKHGLLAEAPAFVDAKSGTTGAGIQPKAATHFPTVNDNFSAYGLKTHRHTIEISETLKNHAGHTLNILFTPHLLPVDRGILSTIYAQARKPTTDAALREQFEDYYRDEPFVRVRRKAPTLKDVRGSNYCDLYPCYVEHTQTILVISVIDNLVKGAAGQAIHNMNIMAGIPESAGLQMIPLQP